MGDAGGQLAQRGQTPAQFQLAVLAGQFLTQAAHLALQRLVGALQAAGDLRVFAQHLPEVIVHRAGRRSRKRF